MQETFLVLALGNARDFLNKKTICNNLNIRIRSDIATRIDIQRLLKFIVSIHYFIRFSNAVGRVVLWFR